MIEFGVIVAVIVGLSQVIKGATPIPVKYIPLMNVVMGMIFGYFFLTDDFKTNIFQGIIIGLTASGLFDQTKIIKKDREPKAYFINLD